MNSCLETYLKPYSINRESYYTFCHDFSKAQVSKNSLDFSRTVVLSFYVLIKGMNLHDFAPECKPM